MIFDFADTIITRFDNRFCFEYEYADIWRRLTREIDEEIFVTAAVVMNDLRRQGASSEKKLIIPEKWTGLTVLNIIIVK